MNPKHFLSLTQTFASFLDTYFLHGALNGIRGVTGLTFDFRFQQKGRLFYKTNLKRFGNKTTLLLIELRGGALATSKSFYLRAPCFLSHALKGSFFVLQRKLSFGAYEIK